MFELAIDLNFLITEIYTRLDRSPISPKNELKELRAAARRSIKTEDDRHWLKAWAAVTDRTRHAVWHPKPPLKNVLMTPISFVAPYPRDALPLVRDAMRQLKEPPAGQRRRTSDRLYDELDELLREAWRVLRGTPLPKPISPERAGGKSLESPLIDLAREIDRHFGLGIDTAKDSRRLRGLSRPA